MSEFRVPNPYDALPSLPSLVVASEEFIGGETVPEPQRGGKMGVPEGEDVSPGVTWDPGPEGTESYTVTVFDPDAPTASGFWHWAVANIPADVTSLPPGAGTPGSDALPEGAVTLRNDAGFAGYVGAAPPAGHGPHRYILAVHAVAEKLPVDGDASCAFLGFNLFSKALARGYVTSVFEQ